MITIRDYLEREHRVCDKRYARAEACLAHADWQGAAYEFAQFRELFERHCQREELVLFPYLERTRGGAVGAIAVLRSEHRQQRTLIAFMSDAVARCEEDEFFDLADTLCSLMNQHNLKEESVLYPMAARLFGHQASTLLAQMMLLGESGDDAVAVA
jgi:hemerythrin-like domain-containing protein